MLFFYRFEKDGNGTTGAERRQGETWDLQVPLEQHVQQGQIRGCQNDREVDLHLPDFLPDEMQSVDFVVVFHPDHDRMVGIPQVANPQQAYSQGERQRASDDSKSVQIVETHDVAGHKGSGHKGRGKTEDHGQVSFQHGVFSFCQIPPVFARVADVMADFRFADLFAGIGGFRVAGEESGGECVFSCEWDRWCNQTYHANFPDSSISGDIRSVADLPPVDILFAGFPCQPFSLAGVSKKNSLGRPHGFEDRQQGDLFFELLRLLKAGRPKAFLLENVSHLCRHDRGKTFETILGHLRSSGYSVSYQILDASAWVPQKRKRVFIAGIRSDVKQDFDLAGLVSPAGSPVLADILESDPDPKYILSQHLWNYLQEYKSKHQQKGNGFGYGLVEPDSVARTLSARYGKDGSEILVSRGESERPRRLTPRECSRLMGFGEDWKIPVSDSQAYRQFGNSVVVPVVRSILQKMLPVLN